ncbi:RecQ family ATP-dependent DNA helicase [Acanthopleuribacter pedis]|uniref:DNA 3'-5' helicase n=1 Tax=Acanthopleuribacter pedis TaxID=442870 RepID=A0A8J7U548_9BACT|nr:RecQ family ATP-dependent DNA helicase [Acanthopleuribacter pedis]MBO1322158.1 RecQ family ATP-dependent DNA helicase [Acanthopleuribacter pedis]
MNEREQAESYLKMALGDPAASFRDGQWESIEQLLLRNRVLVVQRTGWGKSMVYFLATKLLRMQGAGPTLLVSPLLSLMRNQLEAARRIGVFARMMNSANDEEWNAIQEELVENQVDVLLISPERLGNDHFRQNVLAKIAGKIGLFVVDEAHCISDWGHDFRPDYRRIVRVLQAMPENVPVLATTATANNRVVADVQAQIGQTMRVQRGSLVRRSLKLQNMIMPNPAVRLAWLAKTIPELLGSGIVYTLTQRDAERVTQWLRLRGIQAEAYHAGLSDASAREELERKLIRNELKVLVATVALGMGFDKPDLGFVIHYQRPASVVHYYQQVGRAGRSVDDAFGVLLWGEEDDPIAAFFIKNAFPPQQHIAKILEVLDLSDEGLSVPELQRALNLSKIEIEKTLKFLSLDSPSPITKVKSKWLITPAAVHYQVDQEKIAFITRIRREEQLQMQAYMAHSGCLMAFLQAALDDPNPSDCGRCCACNPTPLLDEAVGDDLVNHATLFLRRSYQRILPRKQWPAKDMFVHSPLGGFRIPDEWRAEEGRALCLWRDAGWGRLVAKGKYEAQRFSDELVVACVQMLEVWAPSPRPQWVACIPSLNQSELVPDFAARLASALGLPFIRCVLKTRGNLPRKKMKNSYQQVANLDGVFSIQLESGEYGPCLLVDDMIDSGWTMTVVSALLRERGCSSVYPLALALNSPRRDS